MSSFLTAHQHIIGYSALRRSTVDWMCSRISTTICSNSDDGCRSWFRYTFYDGPPFATGLPHYGHILAGTVKDVVTRWAHQSGFHVERRFGWDCHGLPVVFMHFVYWSFHFCCTAECIYLQIIESHTHTHMHRSFFRWTCYQL